MRFFTSKEATPPPTAPSIQSFSNRRAELRHKPFGASPEDGRYMADAVAPQHAKPAPPTLQSAGVVKHTRVKPPAYKAPSRPIKDIGDVAVQKIIVKPLVYIYRHLGLGR